MKIIKSALPAMVLLFLCTGILAFSALSREQDIGFYFQDDGETVIVSGKPVAESDSPLRIHIGGQTYGIELVEVDHPLASNMRIQTADGTRALKIYSPLSGRFVCRRGPPKYNWTWIATLTCRAADGSTHTLNWGRSSHQISYRLWDIVYNDVNGGSRHGPIELPPRIRFEALRRTTGGSGGGFRWDPNSGNPDLDTLNATCKLYGYEEYVSATCHDGERSGRYPNGKCNFDTPGDNINCYFIPAD
ncbi:MAG: hypothetical protein GF333_06995 [Candidatus Omnitrophica bacterium]|nr:hypothetical protein [Candidatus Omnitrophota bacterium]